MSTVFFFGVSDMTVKVYDWITGQYYGKLRNIQSLCFLEKLAIRRWGEHYFQFIEVVENKQFALM